MFVERILFNVVEERLQWYINDPKRYKQFLLDGGLTETEAENAREAFESRPPTTIHGYARQGGYFPCFALVLGNESTAQDYLGETVMGFDEDGEYYVDVNTGDRVDIHSRRWENRYDWYVYADHPDSCLYYYYLLRHIMLSSLTRLQDSDLDEITYSGAELAPDPRYLPSDMFTRRFTVTLRSDEPYVEDFKPSIGQGASIEGIAIDTDGTSDELTDEQQAELSAAKFNVSTYTEDS